VQLGNISAVCSARRADGLAHRLVRTLRPDKDVCYELSKVGEDEPRDWRAGYMARGGERTGPTILSFRHRKQRTEGLRAPVSRSSPWLLILIGW
jgi:hypothetical protein